MDGKTKTKEIDMLHGPLDGNLIRFALPIAASSMVQQLFNSADTAVVGRFADANALAAVGTNAEIVGLLVAFSSGLSVGANVLLARYIGENRKNSIRKVICSSLLLALVFGILVSLLAQPVAGPLLSAIQTPAEALELAGVYLRIYLIGYPALLVYDFGAAILRAKGDSKRPFFILVISGIINVVLNLFLVIVCGLGVAGVAISTDISTLWSAVMVVILLIREKGDFHLDLQGYRKMEDVSSRCISRMLQIGVPAAVQGAVFCISNLFVQSAINSFGAAATAGSAISLNLEYFDYYIITAFAQTATTFAGQNHAAGNDSRCGQIFRRCLGYAILFSAVVVAVLILNKEKVAGMFSGDSAVIEQACLRMMMLLLLQSMCSLYEVPAGYLRGMGHSAVPAAISIVGTCVFRLIWLVTVFAGIHTLKSLYLVYPVTWTLTAMGMWTAVYLLCVKNKEKPVGQDMRI